jgi:hypothetical protein
MFRLSLGHLQGIAINYVLYRTYPPAALRWIPQGPFQSTDLPVLFVLIRGPCYPGLERINLRVIEDLFGFFQ